MSTDDYTQEDAASQLNQAYPGLKVDHLNVWLYAIDVMVEAAGTIGPDEAVTSAITAKAYLDERYYTTLMDAVEQLQDHTDGYEIV